MKFKLPTYEFLIDDSLESGVKCISIVSEPAFGSKAVFFEKQKPFFVSLADKKKQIVCGLSLIPNVLVFRIDPETGEEYNGYFSAETIEKIVNKFHDEQQGKNVNIEHDPNFKINAYLLEDYIVNTEARVADLKAKGIEHPNIMGSWYTSYKIKDPEVFDAIINGGDRVGFSVETYLEKVLADFQKEVKNKLVDHKVKKEMKKINKSLKEKILAIFTEAEKFERELVPELAFEIEWSEVGAPVNKVIVSEEGVETLQPVGQGEFVTEEGIVVVDEASNLVEVRELPAEPEVEVPEVVVETPEVPIASGDTSMVSSTGILAITDALVEDQSGPVPSGKTETTTSGSTDMVTGGTKCGIQKSILEIVGTTDGEYNILVKVEGGIVTQATSQSMVDLMLSKETEIKDLKEKNAVLEEKNKLPISDPILTPETPVVDFNKLSAYEKLMHNKGLKAVK